MSLLFGGFESRGQRRHSARISRRASAWVRESAAVTLRGLPAGDIPLCAYVAPIAPRRTSKTTEAGSPGPGLSPSSLVGSGGRIRTDGQPVNSRLLYR